MRRTGIRGVVLLGVSLAMLAMASVADAAVVGSKPIASWQANGTVRVEKIVGNTVYLGGSFTAMLPAGSTGTAAIYTEHLKPTHIIRRVLLRQVAITNYVNPF